MSSIRLKEDYGGEKAGRVISVPFVLGQTLIARGVGEYPDAPPPAQVAAIAAAAVDPSADVKRLQQEAIARIREIEGEHAGELKHLDSVIAGVKDQLAKSNEDLAKVNEELRKVSAERDQAVAAMKQKAKDK